MKKNYLNTFKKKKFKGVWFYGYSGVGKTFISKKIAKKIKNSFLIDGDEIRKNISFDLGYTLKDRVIQNKRVLGLAKIVIKNGYFPIISSVYLDSKIFYFAKKQKIKIFNVVSQSCKSKKLKYKKNVVGKKLIQPILNCEIINNNKKNLF